MDRSDEVLLALLWRLRRKISSRGEILIPPAWIFTNAELEVIAHERPTTMEALRHLPDIDAKRRETSGPEFVTAVAQAIPAQSRSTAPSPESSDNKRRASKTKPTSRRPPSKKTTPDPPRSRPMRGTSATGRGGTNLFNTYGKQDYRPGGGGRYDG